MFNMCVKSENCGTFRVLKTTAPHIIDYSIMQKLEEMLKK